MRSHTCCSPSSIESLESRQLMAASPVTITTISNALETGPTAGTFRITRTSNIRSSPLTVMLTLGGTAALNTDYTLSTPTSGRQIAVTIPINAASTNLVVTPIDDKLAEGTETVTVTAAAIDPATAPTASMTITDNDGTATRPVAKPGGPYTVAEGKAITLLGSATAPTGRTISSYQWDLNYDGTTFTVDATGTAPRFNAVNIDGTAAGTAHAIALRVTDSAGIVSTVVPATITVVNAAPTATLTGSTVRLGTNGVVSFSNISDVSADLTAGLTYRYDFNNDGKFDLTTTKSAATVSAGYLRTAGAHTVRATITDKDGGVSSYTTTVTVNRATAAGSVGRGQNVFASDQLDDVLDVDQLV